ncbi:MAG: ABC transporter substrate-binding protein [Egibacteraceae bacterium]
MPADALDAGRPAILVAVLDPTHPFVWNIDAVTRRELVIGGASLAALLATGYGVGDTGAAAAGGTRDWRQPDGSLLRIPTDPQRIAALDVVSGMMIAQAGHGERIAAHLRSDQNLEAGVFQRPAGSGEAGREPDPNIKLIAAQRPDLIIAYTDLEVLDQLAAIAPTAAVTYRDGFSWREYFADSADLAGAKAQGERTVAEIDQRIADLRGRIPAGTSLAVLRAAVGGLGAYPGFYPADLIDDLGLDTPPLLAWSPTATPAASTCPSSSSATWTPT